MQDKAFLEAFNDDFINETMEQCNHLASICVESVASAAYNNVIFEEALSEEVLEEGKNFDKFKDNVKGAGRKVGNAAFKAVQALKMFFKNIYNKIRVAINEFIQNQSVKNTVKAVKDYEANSKDRAGQTVEVPVYRLRADLVFFNNFAALKSIIVDSSYNDKTSEEEAEDKLVAKVVDYMNSGLGLNLGEAKRALSKASSLAEVARIMTSITKYGKDKQQMKISEIIKSGVYEVKDTDAQLKKDYQKGVADLTSFIKDLEKSLGGDADDKAIKMQVRLAQKVLNLQHASYIGHIHYVIAQNKILLTACSQAKKKKFEEKKDVKESVFTEFLGLDLI